MRGCAPPSWLPPRYQWNPDPALRIHASLGRGHDAQLARTLPRLARSVDLRGKAGDDVMRLVDGLPCDADPVLISRMIEHDDDRVRGGVDGLLNGGVGSGRGMRGEGGGANSAEFTD